MGHHRNLPALEQVHACGPSEGGVALVQVMGGEKPLAHLGEIGHTLCSYRWSGTSCVG